MNIYENKAYIALTTIALLLVIISLIGIFFKPGLKLGLEFTGGSFLTAQINEPINTEQIQNALKEKGLESKVSLFKVINGYKLEIDIGTSNNLRESENIKKNIDELINQYTQTRDEQLIKKAKEQLYILTGKQNDNLTPAEIEQLSDEAIKQKRQEYENSIREAVKPFLKDYSLQTITSALGSSFLEKVKITIILAVIFAIIGVLWIFKDITPAFAVLFGAFADLIIALGFMSYANIPLSLASIAALLMLIGYSLDTDILLTSRMIKIHSSQKKAEKAYEAMKTGLTMTSTAILAFIILFIVGYYLRIDIYYTIGAIVLAGLIGDIFATWGINAVLLMNLTKS
jgi:preprotein translocase subunit SecF